MRPALLLLAATVAFWPPRLFHRPPTHSPTPVVAGLDSTSVWARALLGHWSCAGAFASGRPLAADVDFRLVLGGRWLEYHHADRPPGRYEATALWGPAILDSALTTTVLYDNFGGRRRFGASETPEHGVALARDTTEVGARAERFIFRPRADGTLWFAWEVQRTGTWTLGDSLACTRGGP